MKHIMSVFELTRADVKFIAKIWRESSGV